MPSLSRSESAQKKQLRMAVKIGFLMSISHAAYAEETANSIENDQNKKENTATVSSTAATTLDTITIYADSYRSTGTKTALDPNDAPMSYSRINQELLQKRQADSVNAALRYEPGVSTESRGTVSIFDEYNIRGFKTYSNFY